jgi:glycosyltransferase involved in cell wall biosynthesis
LNICIITSSFPSRPDDYVQAPFLPAFIEGLKRRGHHVFVFTQRREGIGRQFIEGIEVNWFKWVGSGRPLVHLNPFNPWDLLRIGSLFLNGMKALLPYLKENRIDVCLALWVLPGGFFANYAHRRLGIRYSAWALGSDIHRYGRNLLLRGTMRRIIREATGVFADGFELSKEVEALFQRKCFFLATTRSLKTDRSDPSYPSDRTYSFLFVGRLERVKGIDILLESLALLSDEVTRDVRLTIVGTGSMERWARDFVDRKGLGGRVIFDGNISDERLASLYLSSNCVVIPSRSESIPLVFSEALRLDKELIVTDVGDMGLLGRKYGAGWVVPPEDPVALMKKMKERVENREEGTRELTREKREELKRLFDIETSVDRFLADYA